MFCSFVTLGPQQKWLANNHLDEWVHSYDTGTSSLARNEKSFTHLKGGRLEVGSELRSMAMA
jgi:hypothetical protein